MKSGVNLFYRANIITESMVICENSRHKLDETIKENAENGFFVECPIWQEGNSVLVKMFKSEVVL